ncbi:uncharacterized protein LOC143963586 [Lithobates pipiens]
MFRVTIALLLACFAGNYSMPLAEDICESMTRDKLLTDIKEHTQHIQRPKGTHAKNVNNCILINCNLDIFKKELNETHQCEKLSNKSTNGCLVYRLLKCVPYIFKVPNTTCQDPDYNSEKVPLKETMLKFIGTMNRGLKLKGEEGNSCEKKKHYRPNI